MWVQDIYDGYVNLDKCDRMDLTEIENGNVSCWAVVTGNDTHTYYLFRGMMYNTDEDDALAMRADGRNEAAAYLEGLIAKVNGHGI